jgi:hypothetical protein
VHCIFDCIRHGFRLAVPQPTEWQGVADEIESSVFLFMFLVWEHRCNHAPEKTWFRKVDPCGGAWPCWLWRFGDSAR